MKIAYITVLIAILFFLSNTWLITDGGDSGRHLQDVQINYSILDGNSLINQTNTAPLYSFISIPFSLHERLWDFLPILLFVGLIPLLIAYLTKNHWAPLFYYSISPLTFQIFQNALFPQGLIIIFFLSLLIVKRNSFRFIIILVGSLAHSTGIYILPITFLLILFNENYEEIKNKFSVFFSWFKNKAFIFCPAFINDPGIESFNQPIKETYLANKSLILDSNYFINQLLIPVVFAYWSIKGLVKEKRYDIILLYPLTFAAFLFFDNPRVFTFIPVLSVIGFSFYWKSISENHKKYFFMAILLYGEIKFVQWLYQTSSAICVNVV